MRKIAFIITLSSLCIISNADIPDFKWAYNLGGWANDYTTSMVMDSNKNVYITGYFSGIADFDPGPDSLMFNTGIGLDIFVQKIDSSGNMIWTKTIGSQNSDVYAMDIALDGNDDLIIVGKHAGPVDFNPGPGVDTLPWFGNFDVFVLKLDNQGNYKWAKTIGGNFGDDASSVAVDNANNIFLTGSFRFTVDFDPGPGNYTLSNSGNSDIFVLKLDELGNFQWAHGHGNDEWNFGKKIEIDVNGDVLVGGWFRDTVDFDPGANTIYLASNGDDDIFIQKLDNNGNLKWVRTFGGQMRENIVGFTLDENGSIFTSGNFELNVDFDPGPGSNTASSVGDSDIFLQKLDSGGNLEWFNIYGDTSFDTGSDIALDADGNILFCGSFNNSVDFDPGPNSMVLNSVNFSDGFLQKLNPNGELLWVYSMGGTSTDFMSNILTDVDGSIYLSGGFGDAVDIDPGTGSYTLISNGTTDLFIQKLQDSLSLEVVGLTQASESLSSVYPNPFKNNLTISSKKEKIQSIVLRDLNGRTILRKNDSGQKEIELYLDLESGFYFLEIITEKGRSVKKLIKE